MIRISDIKIPAAPQEAEWAALEEKMQQWLGEKPRIWRVARHSLDARKKPEIFSVYALDLDLGSPKQEEAFLRRKRKLKAAVIREKAYDPPRYSGRDSAQVIVVGAGPAGLFAALNLARAGLRPLLIEQGAPVEERQKDVEAFWQGGTLKPWSNVQFGEGGAGTFSDGKLSSGIRDKEGRISYMLEAFIRAGAPERIRWEAKPHIGTDVLRQVVKGLREELLAAGGSIRFHTRMTDLLLEDERVKGIAVQDTKTGDCQTLPADALVLAPGHSARGLFRLLQEKGVPMEAKPFAMGLRIQHPQAQINALQYGANPPGYLPAADYKLTARASDGRGVYSFCMCPGGYVVNASSEERRLCVNGMSEAARDGENANAALVVQIRPEDTASAGLFGGLLLQEKWEAAAWQLGEGKIPLQLWEDFAAGRPSGALGAVQPACKGAWQMTDISGILPDYAARALREAMPQFDQTLPGFSRPDSLLCGIESRTSSPLRILRDERGESKIKGLFPCGEGAGYAGGITSAAVDGMRAAEAVTASLV